MLTDEFTPFSNETLTFNIGELEIATQNNKVLLRGNVILDRDDNGLHLSNELEMLSLKLIRAIEGLNRVGELACVPVRNPNSDETEIKHFAPFDSIPNQIRYFGFSIESTEKRVSITADVEILKDTMGLETARLLDWLSKKIHINLCDALTSRDDS